METLVEAGDEGADVRSIAERTGRDPSKLGKLFQLYQRQMGTHLMSVKYLGHILRFLATHHIFREVAPNRFKNNRLAHILLYPKNSSANVRVGPRRTSTQERKW